MEKKASNFYGTYSGMKLCTFCALSPNFLTLGKEIISLNFIKMSVEAIRRRRVWALASSYIGLVLRNSKFNLLELIDWVYKRTIIF